MNLTIGRVFEYLRDNLTVRVEDVSGTAAAGGEAVKVKVTLLLRDPATGATVEIGCDETEIG